MEITCKVFVFGDAIYDLSVFCSSNKNLNTICKERREFWVSTNGKIVDHKANRLIDCRGVTPLFDFMTRTCSCMKSVVSVSFVLTLEALI